MNCMRPRGKGYDQTDRSIRIGLSRRWAGNNPRRNGASYELKDTPARCLHEIPLVASCET